MRSVGKVKVSPLILFAIPQQGIGNLDLNAMFNQELHEKGAKPLPFEKLQAVRSDTFKPIAVNKCH